MLLLCRTSDLDKTSAKSVTIQHQGRSVDIAVVRNHKGIYAYLDVCPHAGTPLEWQQDRFFDESGTYLMCATHGAQFNVHDGLCISGPCVGDSLTRLLLRVIDGEIFLNNDSEG